MNSGQGPRDRRWLLTMLVLLAVLTWQAAPAGADVSQSDGVVTATLIGATKLDDQDWSATPTAVFRIQVLAPNTSVQCRSGDGGNDVPCGTEQSSGCPAYQCRTYSMPIGNNSQYNDLYVDYTGADDTPTYLQFSDMVCPSSSSASNPAASKSISMSRRRGRLIVGDRRRRASATSSPAPPAWIRRCSSG